MSKVFLKKKKIRHVKCVAVGDGAVGKTCMLICYTSGTFPEEYIPTIFDNYTQSLNVDGKNINLQLWDTAGQEDYAKIRPMSYPDTDVFLVCFSLVSPTSLENVSSMWKSEITTAAPNGQIILVGLKKDLRDDFEAKENTDPNVQPIPTEKGQEVAKQIGAREYLECSAKTKENLNEVFEHAVRAVLNPPAQPTQEKQGGCLLI